MGVILAGEHVDFSTFNFANDVKKKPIGKAKNQRADRKEGQLTATRLSCKKKIGQNHHKRRFMERRRYQYGEEIFSIIPFKDISMTSKENSRA